MAGTDVTEGDASGDAELLAELTRMNNELVAAQRKLSRRTAELGRVSEYKNQLIGTMSHDLRNPLGAITGLASLLRERAADRLTDQEVLVLERIERASERMLELLDDLLSLSDVGRGRPALRRDRCDLVEIVASAVEVAQVFADDKGIRIEFTSSADEVVMDADASKLDQAVSNLLSNAVKYSPEGTHVEVHLDNPADRVVLRVLDDGVGIPPEEHETIFEPFTKASPHPTAGEHSTGLGLAIVREIVRAHGGSIDVESAPGEGSTFTVTLDRSPGDRASDEPAGDDDRGP